VAVRPGGAAAARGLLVLQDRLDFATAHRRRRGRTNPEAPALRRGAGWWLLVSHRLLTKKFQSVGQVLGFEHIFLSGGLEGVF
jgi:hypothetical protein